MKSLWSGCADAKPVERMPIFDPHIHYSHDAWAGLPPKVALLRRAGVSRALVSSANDDGTLMLLAEAPELIVPELPPYSKRGEFATWMKDESVPAYLEARLNKAKSVAFGEFHVYGAQVELPVVRKTIDLARRHKLLLHARSDAEAIEGIFKADPEARALWAHAGLERLERVLGLLCRHRHFWADLAVRGDPGTGGRVNPDWLQRLQSSRIASCLAPIPIRPSVGTMYVEPHAEWAREWLKALPRELAEKIAHRNGDALIGLIRKRPGP